MIRYAPRFIISLLLIMTSALNAEGAQYQYKDSPECFLAGNGIEQSALSGFAAGPTAQSISNNRLDQPILRPFTSDGCSVSPDGVPATRDAQAWAHCCVRHDSKYWAGGSEKDKIDADNELEQCISRASSPTIGSIYKLFVTKFGGPMSSKTYRWGYGWNYRRPFQKLSIDELAQIEALYDDKPSAVQERLATQTMQLNRMCSNYDPVFQGFRDEEAKAYEYLNHALTHDDQIEWAGWGYFNSELRELEIKLLGCDRPIKLIFANGSGIVRSLEKAGARCANI